MLPGGRYDTTLREQKRTIAKCGERYCGVDSAYWLAVLQSKQILGASPQRLCRALDPIYGGLPIGKIASAYSSPSGNECPAIAHPFALALLRCGLALIQPRELSRLDGRLGLQTENHDVR